MTFGIVFLIVTQLLMPLLLIVGLWRRKFSGKVSWFVTTLGSGAPIGYVLLAGRWDWIGYYLRVIWLVLFVVVLCLSLRKIVGARSPWWKSPGSVGEWASLLAYAFLAVFFGWLTLAAAQGLGYGNSRAVELSFPLEGGVSYAAQGGNSPLLNYHNVDRAQRFALDIVRLNRAGLRASGVYPVEPEKYVAFGEEITSPCAGEVIETRDGQPDHRGSGTDHENPVGNHVVVRCAGEAADVVLAHMKQGSVAVEKGEEVEEGQLLGRVGNSGNTTEPHLHVHAVRTGSGNVLEGDGVPITFDCRFLVRNSLIFEG